MNPAELLMDLGRWGQAHHTEMLVGLLGVPLLLGGARLALHGRRPAATTHGSARWATPREVRQAGLYGSHGVVLGRLKGRLLADDSERHVLLIAPTRSGKGVGVIIPTLLTWLGSTIVLDPKDGENYDVTARWRHHAAHNRIAYFTPCRAPHACINVSDTIRLKTPKEFGDAYTIAQSLTAPAKMARENATSLHFRELAALTLTAAQLHVAYTVSQPSLAAVWAFLTQFHDSLPACLKAMKTTAHSSHGVHQAIATLTTAISNITGDRELSSVWSTAIRPLVLYNDPFVQRSTNTSTFVLDELQYASDPLSLYMVAPSPRDLERLHPLYRVILDVAMTRLMEHKVRTWQHRLLFCADELPAHGYIHAIDQGAADMAGYGMKGLFVAQDIKQLEDVYGEEPILWGNTDLKIFHAPSNDLTAHRIADKLMGEGTITNPVEQHQGGLMGRRSTSYQHVGRPLLTHDEVMELPAHLEILRLSGLKPILAEKIDYRFDPDFQGRAVL
jgi:type IV secretion system protein VirD4